MKLGLRAKKYEFMLVMLVMLEMFGVLRSPS
jgi:hypothetical protein